MATLTISATMNDSTSGVKASATKSITTTGTAIDLRIIEIGTSEEEIALATEIGDCGYVWVENLDDTNYVEAGFATGVYPVKIGAGQVAMFPAAAATASLFLKANTAAVDVKLYAHEA